MADHILERRVWLARPRPEVFDFFAQLTSLVSGGTVVDDQDEIKVRGRFQEATCCRAAE